MLISSTQIHWEPCSAEFFHLFFLYHNFQIIVLILAVVYRIENRVKHYKTKVSGNTSVVCFLISPIKSGLYSAVPPPSLPHHSAEWQS